VLAAPRRLNESRAPQDLQMTRGVCEGEAGARCKFLNATLPLSHVLQQLETMRMANRLADRREVNVYRLFWTEA
jgi:hypothetical protein